ncbi:hypothetical protein D9757_000953 [Collybiopsis confluens]|uniref:Uncharacterized protein n=1 Tax=Collybiopsis confluens TaxID=2823264 RepID=A0A8H5I147_9AGAR|nr:hypothetical protein D9757_000953 [Collybiopsis confluens]
MIKSPRLYHQSITHTIPRLIKSHIFLHSSAFMLLLATTPGSQSQFEPEMPRPRLTFVALAATLCTIQRKIIPHLFNHLEVFVLLLGLSDPKLNGTAIRFEAFLNSSPFPSFDDGCIKKVAHSHNLYITPIKPSPPTVQPSRLLAGAHNSLTCRQQLSTGYSC